MLKENFEKLSGVEVSDEMFATLNKMYEAADLTEEEFVKLINLNEVKTISERKVEDYVKVALCNSDGECLMADGYNVVRWYRKGESTDSNGKLSLIPLTQADKEFLLSEGLDLQLSSTFDEKVTTV